MENLQKNLAVTYPNYTNRWPADMLPDEESFFSLEATVLYPMLYAHKRHYPLVPRHRDSSYILYCNRMSPDQVDEEDGSHQTVRKNCKFA
jgi:hypothetical protein